MRWNIFLYNKLVNRVPGIKERYHTYRDSRTGVQRLSAWGYLLDLNFRYYILKQTKLNTSTDLEHDRNIKLPDDPESVNCQSCSLEELAEKLKNADIISFDVFDTLILRKFGRPEDTFWLVQKELMYPDLKRIRRHAEYLARQERLKQNKDSEVTLQEIWKKAEELSGIEYQKGMETEIKAELAACYGNPYFLKLIPILKDMGKKLIICSDMYLSCQNIKDLLKNCGYPEFDDYFVSSEYRASKCEGDLYDIILKKYGADRPYFHVGDNEYSDIKKAESRNIETFHYHNVNELGRSIRARDMSPVMQSIYAGLTDGHLHNGLTARTRLYEFGYTYGGLFVTGYCQFIHEYVQKNKTDKILFLARDGDILNKAYQLMFPEEKEKCEYVYWSRLASTKMCAGYFKAHYIQRMVEHKVDQGYKVGKIFATMGLEDMLDDFVHESNYKSESILDRKMSEKLIDFLNRNWTEVCRHYDAEIEEGRKYYEAALGKARTAVAVDVGWVGSGAVTLKYLIEKVWKMDCTLKGLVAGTCDANGVDYEITGIQFAAGDLESYLFSAEDNRDIWKEHDASRGHNLIVELLLCSGNASFRGFTRDENGSYSFTRSHEKINSDEVQKGILDFVKNFQAHPLSDIRISGRDAAAPIAVLYNNESWIQNMIKNTEIKANVE